MKLSMRTKRTFDFFLALLALIFFSFPMVVIALFVKMTSAGPVIYWSDRIGKENRVFRMPKFRSMQVGTPALATHLLRNPTIHLTPIGGFLRKSSLDELPQLWSILKGDMSIVGPRPALFNQDDLVELRRKYGVDRLRPGLTGWAQINGRDQLSISAKVQFDVEYMHRQSLAFDLRILVMTLVQLVRWERVAH